MFLLNKLLLGITILGLTNLQYKMFLLNKRAYIAIFFKPPIYNTKCFY